MSLRDALRIPAAEITDEAVYRDRRRLLAAMAASSRRRSRYTASSVISAAGMRNASRKDMGVSLTAVAIAVASSIRRTQR